MREPTERASAGVLLGRGEAHLGSAENESSCGESVVEGRELLTCRSFNSRFDFNGWTVRSASFAATATTSQSR